MNRKINKSVFTYVLLFFCVFSFFFSIPTFCAYAEEKEIQYSNVLDDLKSDETFKAEDYPQIADDYSLKVIQIAESVNNELFVYVYQPSGNTKGILATQIRISKTINEDCDPIDYDLTFINSDEVFYKYKVEDFTIENAETRLYQIISIFRAWNESFDEPLSVGGTIDYVTFDVSQLWTAYLEDEKVVYSCVKIQSVEVTGKYAGQLRYENAELFNNTWTDAHFIAFSTDFPIDNLIEAKLSYSETHKKCTEESFSSPSRIVILDGPTNKDVTIRCDELGSLVDASNYEFFPATRTWSRIETVSEFLAEEKIKSDSKDELNGLSYVLRFAETLRKGSYNGEEKKMYADYYTISEISVMRLKFQTNGVTYNLGVVDNKQSGDGKPDNFNDKTVNWFALIMPLVIIGFISLCVFAPNFVLKTFSFVGKTLWYVIKYASIGLWYVLKYLAIGLWYVVKYTAIGIWWLIKKMYACVKWFITLPFEATA